MVLTKSWTYDKSVRHYPRRELTNCFSVLEVEIAVNYDITNDFTSFIKDSRSLQVIFNKIIIELPFFNII